MPKVVCRPVGSRRVATLIVAARVARGMCIRAEHTSGIEMLKAAKHWGHAAEQSSCGAGHERATAQPGNGAAVA